MVGSCKHLGAATGAQTPVTDQTPSVQEAVGVPAKPVLHLGVHVTPLAEFATQSPCAPFITTGKPLQGLGLHVPAVAHTPFSQVALNVPENPVLHYRVRIE